MKVKKILPRKQLRLLLIGLLCVGLVAPPLHSGPAVAAVAPAIAATIAIARPLVISAVRTITSQHVAPQILSLLVAVKTTWNSSLNQKSATPPSNATQTTNANNASDLLQHPTPVSITTLPTAQTPAAPAEPATANPQNVAVPITPANINERVAQTVGATQNTQNLSFQLPEPANHIPVAPPQRFAHESGILKVFLEHLSVNNPTEISPLQQELIRYYTKLAENEFVLKEWRAKDPQFDAWYKTQRAILFNCMPACNSMDRTAAERASARLAISDSPIVDHYLEVFRYQIQHIFFITEGPDKGKLKYPDVDAHASKKICAFFAPSVISNKAFGEAIRKQHLPGIDEALSPGLGSYVRSAVKAIKNGFSPREDIEQTIKNHPYNQTLPHFLDAYEKGNLLEVQKIAAQFPGDRLMNELTQDLQSKIYNQYGIARTLENDPLFKSLPAHDKLALQGNKPLQDQTNAKLSQRFQQKQALEDHLHIPHNSALAAQLSDFHYSLLDNMDDAWKQHAMVADFVAANPVMEGTNLRELYFDERGVWRLLEKDAFVDQLSWPKNISPEHQAFLNNIIIARHIFNGLEPYSSALEYAITDLNAAVNQQPNAGHIFKAIYYSIVNPNAVVELTKNPLLQCGNFHEVLPTEQQNLIQQAICGTLNDGLKIFLNNSNNLSFSNGEVFKELFTRFVSSLETARKCNADGDMTHAVEALGNVSTVFNQLSSDSASPGQVAAFNAFFTPEGIWKPLSQDAPSVPQGFGSSSYTQERTYLNSCLILKQALPEQDRKSLDLCANLIVNAVTHHPSLLDSYRPTYQFLHAAITSPEMAAQFPQSCEAIKKLSDSGLAYENKNQTGAHSDIVRVLGQGITEFALPSQTQSPHEMGKSQDGSLTQLINACNTAHNLNSSGKPHEAVERVFPYLKDFKFQPQGPLSLKLQLSETTDATKKFIKNHPKTAAGTGAMLVGAGAIKTAMANTQAVDQPNVTDATAAHPDFPPDSTALEQHMQDDNGLPAEEEIKEEPKKETLGVAAAGGGAPPPRDNKNFGSPATNPPPPEPPPASKDRYKTLKNGQKVRISRPENASAIPRWEDMKWIELKNLPDFVQKIAQNTGWNEQSIQEIRTHLFETIQQLRNGPGRFGSDHEIAEALDRLYKGDFVKNDLQLLKHELTELLHIKNNPGASYEEAHAAANLIHKWESLEFID